MSEQHTCHISNLWYIWHVWHLSFGMHIYFNMGVKRSVRTAGMQQTFLDILQNCFEGQKLKYSVSWFFLCIFQNFLYIFFESRGSTSRPPRNLKLLVCLIIPHRNGISLSANLDRIFFIFLDPPPTVYKQNVLWKQMLNLIFFLLP